MIEVGDKIKILNHPNDNENIFIGKTGVVINNNSDKPFVEVYLDFVYMIGNRKFNTALFDEKELEVIEKYNGSVIINV